MRAPREDSGSNDRLGSASPYPDSSNGRGRGDSREGETRVKLEEGEEMEQDGEEDEEGNEEDAMAAMLGFGGFGSTKVRRVSTFLNSRHPTCCSSTSCFPSRQDFSIKDSG